MYLEAVYRKPRYLATVIFSMQAILLGFTASGCIVSSLASVSARRITRIGADPIGRSLLRSRYLLINFNCTRF